MTRESLIAIIRSLLEQPSRSRGESLADIVDALAEQLHWSSQHAWDQQEISVESIAAFVQGTATVQEQRQILDSLPTDQQLQFEVVSAIQATLPASDVQQISPAVRQRLLNVVASNSQQRGPKPASEIIPPPISRASQHAIARPLSAPVSIENDDSGHTHPDLSHPERTHSKRSKWSLSLVVVASLLAMLLVVALVPVVQQAVVWWLPPADDGSSNSDSAESQDRPAPIVPELAQDDPDDQDLQDSAEADPFDATNVAPESLANAMSNDPAVATLPSVDPADDAEADNRSAAVVPTPSTQQQDQAMEPAMLPTQSLPSLQWTSLQGLVARSLPGEPEGEYGDGRIWQQLSPAVHKFEASGEAEQVTVLPLGRAVAKLSDEAELTVAPDSALRVWPTDESAWQIDLKYGAFAIRSLSPGTRVALRGAGRDLCELTAEVESDVVVGFTAEGLQLWVPKGAVAADGKQLKLRGLLLVTGDGTTSPMSPIRPPRRMPLWFEQRTAGIEIPDDVLAQLNTFPELNKSLHLAVLTALQEPNRNALQQKRVQLLAQWQVHLADELSFRLTYSRQPVVRQAALQYLLEMPKWDPRYAPLWANVTQNLGDDRPAHAIQQIAAITQRPDGALTPAQWETLVDGLEHRSLGGRALSEFLLRRFATNGPSFDPTWTGQNLSRGVLQWRRYLNQINSRR